MESIHEVQYIPKENSDEMIQSPPPATSTAEGAIEESPSVKSDTHAHVQALPDNVSTASEDSTVPALTVDRFFKGVDRIGDVYRITKFLDGGTSGNVFAVQRFPETNRTYVAKIFRAATNSFEREVSALQNIGAHPNIVALVDVLMEVEYRSEADPSRNKVVNAIILEYCPNGSLFQYVEACKVMRPQCSRRIFLDIVKTLKHMQTTGYSHRDLKLENILFDSAYDVKLCDFGYAQDASKCNKNSKFTTILGTEGYMAPELTQQQPYYGEKADVFAAGVVLYLLCTKTFPMIARASKNDKKYKDFVQRKTQFWNNTYTDLKKMKGVGKERADEILTADLQSLVDGMLHEDEKKRFTLDEVLHHPWSQLEADTSAQICDFLGKHRHTVVRDIDKRAKDTNPYEFLDTYNGGNTNAAKTLPVGAFK